MSDWIQFARCWPPDTAYPIWVFDSEFDKLELVRNRAVSNFPTQSAVKKQLFWKVISIEEIKPPDMPTKQHFCSYSYKRCFREEGGPLTVSGPGFSMTVRFCPFCGYSIEDDE